jgi:adenylate kinase family enzyme
METRVLITGASGCGTTTLGKALALRVGAAFYDTDDYYWTPSAPPFRNKTPPATQLARLLEDLREAPVAVIAGSIMVRLRPLEGRHSRHEDAVVCEPPALQPDPSPSQDRNAPAD